MSTPRSANVTLRGKTTRLCDCTDGARQQPFQDCHDCGGTGETSSPPHSRGVRVNEQHLERVFVALAARAEQQERVTVHPYRPEESAQSLRVLRLSRFGGAAEILHSWKAR